MSLERMTNEFQIQSLPIVGSYNRQRFPQWSPEDNANWYLVKDENTKRPYAMYPAMGRAHIRANGVDQLIFSAEPREEFKTIDYAYIVIGNSIYRVDKNYNQVNITASVQLATLAGHIYFDYLVVGSIVFAVFCDSAHVYVYREDTGVFAIVTDVNCPGGIGSGTSPGFVIAFGNRIAVSVADSSQFFLSVINLAGNSFNVATCFTGPNGAVFAYEDGIIRQMGVLNNTLYIFCDFVTGVWSNIAAVFSGTGVSFPWKKSSTYNWNFGMANPNSLDIDFGMMVWLAQNKNGLLQFMVSDGSQPKALSSKAINTMLQNYTNSGSNPFLSDNSNGFLYQYEDNIFYRMSGGLFDNSQLLDQTSGNNSIEYNFETMEWHRCIEYNGERNRINLHLYFNSTHWVTVLGQKTIYNMSGQYYTNEIEDTANPGSYVQQAMRYERVTPIISMPDYAEFETEYIQIDFVWGDSNINRGNTVTSTTWTTIFNPEIELYVSDDGGISFCTVDHLQFSNEGVYSWRMRWYQCGCSRNRVYKLVCYSAVPIVILGGVMNVRRVSDGSN